MLEQVESLRDRTSLEEGSAISEIVEAVYGIDPVTGQEKLKAFCSVTCQAGDYYFDISYEWFQSAEKGTSCSPYFESIFSKKLEERRAKKEEAEKRRPKLPR